LVYQLRIENKWKIPPELWTKISELQINVNDLPPTRQIYSELEKYWHSIKKTDSPRFRGRIKNILPNGISGFIGGENNIDYYFRFKDFCGKKSDIAVGLSVEFSTEKSYDKKKNRESEMAVDIIILD